MQEKSPSSFTRQYVFAIVIAILLNSLAIAYGFRKVAGLASTIHWVSAATSEVAGTLAREPRPLLLRGQVRVEVFSDFGCEPCRSNAIAIDSARAHFGERVTWEYRPFPLPPTQDPLGFQAAQIGVCIGGSTGPWGLFEVLNDTIAWGEESLRRALHGLGHSEADINRCVSSPEVSSQVWASVLVGAARGVSVTPTTFVNDLKIEGRLSAPQLINIIESQLLDPELLPWPPQGDSAISSAKN